MRIHHYALMSLALSVVVASCSASVNRNNGEGGDDVFNGDGGAGGASSSSSGAGGMMDAGLPDPNMGCTKAADCAAFNGSCKVGQCINGKCQQSPANEFGTCDDGLYCTENDICQNGACVGSSKFCPSLDSCHLGVCDEALKTCKNIPGNEGQQCEDMNPCTYTGVCNSGVCTQGQMIDCSVFDSTCTKGVCDPVVGCKAIPTNDGVACDDQLYCTINDKCSNGQCTGAPNTCAAPGDVCMIGSCDEATDTCVAVPGNDGAACDDASLCTSGEKCMAGTCVGGQAANDGMACDDKDACTGGTTCSMGTCGNPQSQIGQCINGDACCPAGCQGNDNDCLVCHAIIGPPGQGFACPTGATQFCVPPPLNPASPAQAKAACEACYGVACFEENADCAGPGFGPDPPGQYQGGNAYFGYTSGCSGDDGRVWAISSSFTTYGYWGK